MKLFGSLPLILTLQLDAASAGRFTAERKRYFPPARNHLDAHVTLFHKLPADSAARIETDLEIETGKLSPFAVGVSSLRLLGRGVAYALSSPEVEALRARLSHRWRGLLGPQDRQRIRPHVTVQNKVEPERARALHEQLSASFIPFAVQAEGLSLWEYRGGPWAHLRTYVFGQT